MNSRQRAAKGRQDMQLEFVTNMSDTRFERLMANRARSVAQNGLFKPIVTYRADELEFENQQKERRIEAEAARKAMGSRPGRR